jgi:hypothetical protein
LQIYQRCKTLFAVPVDVPVSGAEYVAQPYVPKIEALKNQLESGKQYVFNVIHDPWCALLKGGGPCNCDPEVTATEADLT